jgi:uncharacterized protein (TIGR01777 family)
MTPKKIVIAGGAGFLGRALVDHWSTTGADLVVLSRAEASQQLLGARTVRWDARTEGPWTRELDGADVLVNLCGRSVDCRYNEANRKLIYASRLESTRALGQALAVAQSPPRCWLNAASATIYRHAEDRPQDEFDGELGDGFSVDVCRQWEAELQAADTPRTRKVAMRTAITLGRGGGALSPLLNLARLGMGGAQGPGTQMVSWLHVRDFCHAVDFLIATEALSGAVNLSAPESMSNEDFMARMRAAVGVRVGLPQPTWALALGAWLIRTETELLLKSRWVYSKRLLDAGFGFEFGKLDEALKDLVR